MAIALVDIIGSAALSIKGSAGTLVGYDLSSIDPSPAVISFYDKATAPVFGVDSPVVKILISQNQRADRTLTSAVVVTSGLQMIVSTMHGVQLLNVIGYVEFT